MPRFDQNKQKFKQSEFDPCYFRLVLKGGNRVDILMYVDDGYVVTNSRAAADEALAILHKKFKLSRKSAQYFLGNDLAVAV